MSLKPSVSVASSASPVSSPASAFASSPRFYAADVSDSSISPPNRGFVIDLGNCGVPPFGQPHTDMGGFVAYLPGYLQIALGEAELEAAHAQLLSHEVII